MGVTTTEAMEAVASSDQSGQCVPRLVTPTNQNEKEEGVAW
jgi:hypothetical protein